MKKTDIRKEVYQQRERMSYDDLNYKSDIIFDRLINMKEYKEANVIYAYIDFKNEVSTRRIIEHSLKNGKEVAVPRIDDSIMNFYKINSFDELKAGYFNILEPISECIPQTPDIVLVPGVAFSTKGERIGYGKGFYDRFLNENMLKIGLAFEYQVYTKLPILEHDILMNRIITENRIIDT